MRIIRGLLFTGIAALLVGYGINRNILNEKFPFLEQAVQTDVAEKIQVLTSPEGIDLLIAPPDFYSLIKPKSARNVNFIMFLALFTCFYIVYMDVYML